MRRLLTSAASIAALLAVILSAVPARSDQTGTVGNGGKAVAHRAGGAVETDPALGAAAPTALLFDTGRDAAEPTIGTTSDGGVFMFASPTNTDIEIARSTDNGANWADVSPKIVAGVGRHPVDLDPYLYVDPTTDRVFMADLYAACTEMSWSDDRGKSWTTNPVACGLPVDDHETIFAGKPVTSSTMGYPNVVYYCENGLVALWCAKSTNGGLTFIPGTTPAYDGINTDCDVITGHGVAGPDGAIYLPKANFCGRTALSISRDEGANWTVVYPSTMTGAPGHEASAAIDSSNTIYYFWIAKDRLPYLVHSTDGGATWSSPLMVGAPGVKEANQPSIAVGSDGKVVMAYYGSTNSPGPPFTGSYSRVTWNGYMTETTDALAADPLFYSGPVNTPDDPFVRRDCGPDRCQNVYDFIDVTVAPDGTAWSAWVDTCITSCVTSPGVTNNGARGMAARFVDGPSLR